MPEQHPGPSGVRRRRRALLACALLSLLCSAGFVLAPVDQPRAVYSWPAAAGDARPAVAGVFTGSRSSDGLSVDVTANTVFQTSPSGLKTTLAVLSLLSLAG